MWIILLFFFHTKTILKEECFQFLEIVRLVHLLFVYCLQTCSNKEHQTGIQLILKIVLLPFIIQLIWHRL